MGVKFSNLPEASEVSRDDYIAVLDLSDNIVKKAKVADMASPVYTGTKSQWDQLPAADKAKYKMVAIIDA